MADNCKLCEWSLPSDKEGPCISIPATEDAYRCPDFWPIGKDEDTLEKVALDMYREILRYDEEYPDEVPGIDKPERQYGDRLNNLGVVSHA